MRAIILLGSVLLGILAAQLSPASKNLPTLQDDIAQRINRIDLLLPGSKEAFLTSLTAICKDELPCVEAAKKVGREFDEAIGDYNTVVIAYSTESADRYELCTAAEQSASQAAQQWAQFVKKYTAL